MSKVAILLVLFQILDIITLCLNIQQFLFHML